MSLVAGAAASFVCLGVNVGVARAACCYFSAKDKDVNQPAQKAFITWDEGEKVESFTVQPKFEGNAQDFGMVVPTPGKPKLDEMPRDFFKELAVFTILKKREYPQSKLLPRIETRVLASAMPAGAAGAKYDKAKSSVVVLEAGGGGSPHHKGIPAPQAGEFFA